MAIQPTASSLCARLGRTAVLTLALSAPAAAAGQTAGPPGEPSDSVTVVPGARYAAGRLRRFLLGSHYRDLWTTPIRVPVLDLEHFAGGLTPTRSHLGSQTRSLRFVGGDGRTYQFRSVFKTPAARLPGDLQDTPVAELLQDGASASHPLGTLVAARLLEAAGVLHAEPYLAVMPDDPALGAFRNDFAGMLGIVEERPNEADREGRGGFGRAIKVVGPDRLFSLLDAGPADRVDARAFLTARMIDILIGDRDRHRDNWRWALLADTGAATLWEPISRDHDEAFVKLDGALLALAKYYRPQLTSFGPGYDRTLNLNWHAREVDRRFLAGLDWTVWDSVATWVVARLDDRTIARAVHALPPPMYARGGAELERALRSRRDGLRDEIHRYYRLLARQVDIHATNAAEVAEITRRRDASVRITVRAAAPGTDPYFDRTFSPELTHEIRLAMWGGDDRVVVRGEGDARITLRVTGGKGHDHLADSSRAGHVRFYDASAHTDADLGRSSRLDRRPYPEWIGSDLDRYPPRDWGSWTRLVPWLEADPDFGILLGGGVARTGYGFRRSPYAYTLTLRAGHATGDGWGRLELFGDVRREGSEAHLTASASYSGIDVLRYHGLGNDSPGGSSSSPFRAELDQFRLASALVLPVRSHVILSIGPWLSVSRTEREASSFFSAVSDTLYGAGSFTRGGVEAGLDFDTRDAHTAPTRGFLFRASGNLVPGLGDVRNAYARLGGEARTYVTAAGTPLRPTLALRARGVTIVGEAPFQDAAFLGGRHSLRGWSRERFAGDAAVSGSAELRVRLSRFRLMLPGDFGVFALADVGRVYVDGASPGGWHAGSGGGIWFAFIDRASTMTISVAHGPERTAVYAGLDFVF